MEQIKNIVISEIDEGKRLDAFLAEVFCDKSRTQIQNLIKNEKIILNSKNVKSSYILKEKDEVRATLFDEQEIEILPQEIELDIQYEDDSMLVVNKPKNMLTHPTTKERTNTLVNALLNKYGYQGLSDLNGIYRPGILHRLDRNTSGLLMVAKTNAAHEFLTQQIKEKTAIRKYLAIISGNLESKEGTISTDIGRHPSKPEKMAVVEKGKASITHYKILENFKGYSFVELRLDTGRTHQIRVHMSHIKHPIVNDSLYGGEKLKVKTTQQVLQAYDLSFTSIKSNCIINVSISPDEDIQKVLNFLRSKQ